jgi:2-oxoglutarate/2-oxoacid ferredoxin oxidoreductase subunit beta
MYSTELDDYVNHECEIDHVHYDIEDYEGEVARWCKGCGDHAILSAVQKILRDRQIQPESVVCVSGIGCSSRFPYYLKTYGFHGIHGRALPISTGVSLARPDLHVITVMGDGDCFSIGAGHWLHALRYNINLTVLVFDNEVYALTKKQASPTTKIGVQTNTTPHGSYLAALNPLSVILGVTNISFLAQSATWLPGHLSRTIEKAWDHKGLSFVRILQRCPIFSPDAFMEGTKVKAPMLFLKDKNGIELDPSNEKLGEVIDHNPKDINHARIIADDAEKEPMGLLYHNPNVPTYNDVRSSKITVREPSQKVRDFNQELDKYVI